MALIIPEIYSKITREKFEGNIKVARLATALGDLKNTTVGETIHFPKFKMMGEANEVVKGVESPIYSLDQSDSTATIKMIDHIAKIYDIENITVIGNQIEEASSQQALIFARKLDKDLIEEASNTSLKYATADGKAITANELNEALALFGDENDVEEFGGIVINSILDSSFYSMEEFVDVNKTYNTNGNGIVRNGMIGYFRGIPVFHANNGNYDSATNECKTFIIKKNSLAYMEKKSIDIKEQREEKLHCSFVVGTYIYAVKQIKDDGIIMLKKTIV
ncbi:hypothetical protein [Clostridium kluyveri]|uniref:Uncharacterized protein n=1 Tax=Clostridium kluyveri TaxID=1534 RepID=A0A1L5F477_CLOKL|nr:hypothetical protein [Clostridium kluyveri]APM37804.1 hypothetical protein BS101_03115 [Clostridium kluyveri]